MPPKKAVFRAYFSYLESIFSRYFCFSTPWHKFKWLLCIERGFLEDSTIKKTFFSWFLSIYRRSFMIFKPAVWPGQLPTFAKLLSKKYSDQINKRTGRNKGVLVGKIMKINKCTGYVYSGP